MNYGDHNFIEITQQTKLRVQPVKLDFVERVNFVKPVELLVSSKSSYAVRQCRHSPNAWARHVERVESSRVESSQVKFGLYRSQTYF